MAAYNLSEALKIAEHVTHFFYDDVVFIGPADPEQFADFWNNHNRAVVNYWALDDKVKKVFSDMNVHEFNVYNLVLDDNDWNYTIYEYDHKGDWDVRFAFVSEDEY